MCMSEMTLSVLQWKKKEDHKMLSASIRTTAQAQMGIFL